MGSPLVKGSSSKNVEYRGFFEISFRFRSLSLKKEKTKCNSVGGGRPSWLCYNRRINFLTFHKQKEDIKIVANYDTRLLVQALSVSDRYDTRIGT